LVYHFVDDSGQWARHADRVVKGEPDQLLREHGLGRDKTDQDDEQDDGPRACGRRAKAPHYLHLPRFSFLMFVWACLRVVAMAQRQAVWGGRAFTSLAKSRNPPPRGRLRTPRSGGFSPASPTL